MTVEWSAAAPAAVRLDHVAAGYGRRVALADVTLAVPPGSLLAVVGPNGAGKSTLLKLIAGLMQPQRGAVEVLGQPAGRRARDVAYVPQAEAVDWDFPVTVGDVAMMGRYGRIGFGRRPSGEDRRRVGAALEIVGLMDERDRQIGELSGGQRRRVFLARAFAAQPDLYLLDEPVTGVDAATQEDLMDVLAAEARAGKTVIAATHDLISASRRFDQAALINGRLIATGPAEIVMDRDLLSATYGGHILLLPGEPGLLALEGAHHHDPAIGAERHFHKEGVG
ncbi:MAG TPA: metal ABC transporter ATP-binding protein [Candidatus Limnocylindrales bacterium]|jgi:ABC-type Mn2+/Zn2+ transport system ATPase subunit|nr:metal ABC transporter ATP-binding protein [Candidatus Limnocylindrales bacterium]